MLGSRFINAWVLARDLPRLAEDAEHPAVRRACELLQEHYTYPVDSIVIGPDLDVRGQMDVNQAMRSGPMSYLQFLREALSAEATSSESDREDRSARQ